MKVLHILQSPTFSGAENVACQIIKMFDNSGYEMSYCSPDGSVKEAVEGMGIKYVCLSKFSSTAIRDIINFYNPDIIHAHDMRASYLTSLVCKRIPLISHIHNNNFNSRGFSIKSIAYLYAAIKAKQILWVSKSSFNGYYFHKILKGKSTILYNVINLDNLNKKCEESKDIYNFDVVFLGRLTYQKNPLRLIDIFKIALSKKHLKIGIIGDGDLMDETKRKVTDLGLNDNITFTGYCKNPMRMISNAKVMVMSSLWEGTPMCALEALGLGTPIVSTPVDGLKDIVQNNFNGFLSNSNEELADYICKITSDNNFYKELSANSKATSAKINNITSYRDVLSRIYHKALTNE